MTDMICLSYSLGSCTGPGRETKKKVLLVDDEYLIRYSLKKLIEQEGYEVFAAASEHEALRFFEERKPDVVILDIHLPDANGLVILKTIKEISPSAIVMMATGCPDFEHLRTLMHAEKRQSPVEPLPDYGTA